jgi:GNAT superfamily N-acetyltransferase
MSEDAPSIRVAMPADLAVVVRLMEELVDELGPTDLSQKLKKKLPADLTLALASPTVRVFLAETDRAAVGLSRGDILTGDPIFRLRDDNRCGYIDQMYVQLAHRHGGLGGKLLHACEDWFREQGINHSILHAAPRAVRLYAREGYLPNREMFKRLL